MDKAPKLAAIVLAGGRSTRMGRDKAQVVAHGERLIDRLLRQLPSQVVSVVVSPAALGVSCPVVCEDPPHSGPVAGVATGVAWIAHTHPTISLVAVLAVDAPDSPLLIPQLADALRGAGPQVDAVTVLADGYVQPLGVLWRIAALQAALARVDDFTKTPLKRLLRGANVITITPAGGIERDYDTPEELQNLPPAMPIVPASETQ